MAATEELHYTKKRNETESGANERVRKQTYCVLIVLRLR